MTAHSSISRVPAVRHTSRHIRSLALLSFIIVGILLAAGILTFIRASSLMQAPSRELETFSSNILPDFQLAGFPSLDEQTQLSGWFFPAAGEPVSTIILVHDQGENRLQFGLDSASLIEFLTGLHFSVLAFDLRHSGQSEGKMSGYGYAEWADVLAAIRYVRKISVTTDVLLFGFGTGVSASLIALDQLPPAGLAADAAAGSMEAAAVLEEYPEAIRKLGFDQSYVCGLLLDTPCESPDSYIRAVCRQQGGLGLLLQYTVPYAIRLSAGNIGRINLITILTRSQQPVFISYSRQGSRIEADETDLLVRERLRFHPDTTAVHVYDEPGYLEGFLLDQENYLEMLRQYLQQFSG
ncbi:MAG TPA: hypothetical protein DD640_10615 [Clostridiales bacterium]|nr:hypothetical protein [Clostridiales bacterium]